MELIYSVAKNGFYRNVCKSCNNTLSEIIHLTVQIVYLLTPLTGLDIHNYTGIPCPDMHHYLFTTAAQQMFSSHLAIVGIDRDNANVGIRGCQWSLVTIIVVTSGTHHQPLNTLPLFTDNPANLFQIDNLTSNGPSQSSEAAPLVYIPAPLWSDDEASLGSGCQY